MLTKRRSLKSIPRTTRSPRSDDPRRVDAAGYGRQECVGYAFDRVAAYRRGMSTAVEVLPVRSDCRARRRRLVKQRTCLLRSRSAGNGNKAELAGQSTTIRIRSRRRSLCVHFGAGPFGPSSTSSSTLSPCPSSLTGLDASHFAVGKLASIDAFGASCPTLDEEQPRRAARSKQPRQPAISKSCPGCDAADRPSLLKPFCAGRCGVR